MDMTLPNPRVAFFPQVPNTIDGPVRQYLQDLLSALERAHGKQFDNVYHVSQTVATSAYLVAANSTDTSPAYLGNKILNSISITGTGLQLVGDEALPTAYTFYGVNGLGTKGFYDPFVFSTGTSGTFIDSSGATVTVTNGIITALT